MTPAFLGLVSELQASNKTGKAMGIIQSANLAGTIIGPIIGGLISELTGVRECFFIVMIVTAITVALNIFVVKEPSAIHQDNTNQQLPDDNSFAPLIKRSCYSVFGMLYFYQCHVYHDGSADVIYLRDFTY